MKKILLSIMTVIGLTLPALATNPITPAMPSLTIAPDAHAAGMGDMGAATNPDLNSQHWNPSKYAFMESQGGLTVNYTPWLTKLVNDINLAYIAGYYNIGEMAGTVSGSFRYFSMGEVQLVDYTGTAFQEAHPNEWAIDVAYSRKLHEYLSMAVALRFLYSDLNNGVNSSANNNSTEMHPAWTMAADVSLYYRQPIELPMGTSHFNLGFTLKNLGGKMNYADDGSSNFIPASMNIGVGYELPCDKYNFLTFNVEANKLLVPSRNSAFTEGFDPNDETTWQMSQVEYSNLNSAKGWFQSFADAPGGIAEEFREVRWGAGIEYSYNKQFFARAGYSYENFYKGNRNYVTFGAGFHLSIVSLDVAYCVGLAASNPLDQTMRFTLGFDLAGIEDLVNNKK